MGNTTKAITKGIAIATAVLAATALFGGLYSTSVVDAVIDAGSLSADDETALNFLVYNPGVLVGVLLGASVVFLFSGLAINAVGRAAGAVVYEVRRQFRDIPGIMEGTGRPEYGKVVDIVTKDSLRELVTPGLLAVLAPIAVGFGLGVAPLAGFLAGAIGSGTLMAIFLANSAAPGTTPRSSSRTVTTAARARAPTRPPSSVTPSETRSRTPPLDCSCRSR